MRKNVASGNPSYSVICHRALTDGIDHVNLALNCSQLQGTLLQKLGLVLKDFTFLEDVYAGADMLSYINARKTISK